MFLGTIKGLLWCFKSQKLILAFSAKKSGVLFYMMCDTKNLEACCDAATASFKHFQCQNPRFRVFEVGTGRIFKTSK